jgi:hypothetical protein
VLARCPSCRNTFSTDRSGRQVCPICGKPLVVPEAPSSALPPVAGASPQAAPDAPRPGTPWERRDELGNFNAWVQTMQLALFEPAKLFASARLDKNRAQLGFALVTGSIFWAAGQLLDRFLVGDRMKPLMDQFLAGREVAPWVRTWLETSARLNTPGTAILLALFTPAVVLLLLYANAGVTHVIALALGQAKRGFAATFAACAYGFAPFVLFAVPGCGSLIGILWSVVLIGVGLRETHRISTGGAAATVLAPYVVLCCIGCGGSIALVLALGRGLGGH